MKRFCYINLPDDLTKLTDFQPSPNIRLVSRITAYLSTIHSVAALVSFLVFLVNGRYRTLIDRILHLKLVAPTGQMSRQVSFEYLNRQLVWHAFTEFLLFFLPLLGISRWRRWLSRALRKAKALARMNGRDHDEEVSKKGELAFLPERTCAICYRDQNPSSTMESEVIAITSTSGGVVGSAQTDVTNPYQTTVCGCVYCFVCIATKLEAEDGEGFVCLRCGELVKECRPWAGDVIEQSKMLTNKKSVTFSDEGLSGESNEVDVAPLHDVKDMDSRDLNEQPEQEHNIPNHRPTPREWTH